MKKTLLAGFLGLAACTQGAVESNISPEFPFQMVSRIASDESIAFFETGQGPTTVVMMHGIPTNAYLWRNVAPIVGDGSRVVAVDLPGYGQSSVPANGNVDYDALYEPMAAYLDGRPEQEFVLVVNDLGSLLGIDYAMRNPDRIKGIVFVEAIFMPAESWLDQLGVTQRVMFRAMRNDAIARFMITNEPRLQSLALTLGTSRELSVEERAAYLAPYADEARREVVLNGPGPATMPVGGVSRSPQDFAAIADRNAAALRRSDVPKLLLTADPGFIVRPPAVAYAQSNLSNLSIVNVGHGIHFLPEDQPTAIGVAIRDWVAGL